MSLTTSSTIGRYEVVRELGHEPEEPPVGVERDVADHPEHARHPGAHPLADAGRAGCVGDDFRV